MHTKKILSLAFALGLASCASEEAPVNTAEEQYPFDRHGALSAADGTPGQSALEGAEGVLGYEHGCLFVERDGGRSGLILPANSSFDGRVLRYRNLELKLGQRLTFTGDLLATPDRGEYGCKYDELLEVAP